MRRNVVTIAFVGAILIFLIALNLILVSQQAVGETEMTGDRSSYKGTPYGTLAWYTLLEERNRRVVRFEEPYTSLLESDVETFVIVVPHTTLQPTEDELLTLLLWVEEGGRLVVIDRQIQLELDSLKIETGGLIGEPVTPLGPTSLTRGVQEIKLSEFGRTVAFVPATGVVNFANPRGSLLIDTPQGAGHMTFLSEPYLVQNNGIREANNMVLAINLVEAFGGAGTIAFDEYHHGYGVSDGKERIGSLRDYIAGTPIPWMVAQLGLVALAVSYSVGRRFGRPVPFIRTRRTSALEFVSSMATIQRLAEASDLAVENIYSHFRTRLSRYAGVPSNTPTEQLARAVARRGQIAPEPLLLVLRRAETILAGGPRPSQKELVDLIAELRRLESRFGI